MADNEADGSLLAFFTDTDADADPDGAPWTKLLTELEQALADAGLPVRDAWFVGADYWRNAYCLDPSCCAPPGRPVDEIRNSRLNAEMVFRGSTVGAAPGDGLRTPPGAADPAVLNAQRDWAELFSARARDSVQFGQVLDVWSRVLNAAAPLPQTAGGAHGLPEGVPLRSALARRRPGDGGRRARRPPSAAPRSSVCSTTAHRVRGRWRLFHCRRWTDSRHGSRGPGEPGAAAPL